MKVCLISPYENVAGYGLRILSSVLKGDGHKVECIFPTSDFLGEIPRPALQQTAEHAAASDLVGISLTSNYLQKAIEITRAIKAFCSDVKVLWGGIPPTIEPIMSLEYCDIACVGEAEDALAELAGKMDGGMPYTDTLNFHFKTPEGKIISNDVRPLNHDLDTIPFPDYSTEGHFIMHNGYLLPAARNVSFGNSKPQ